MLPGAVAVFITGAAVMVAELIAARLTAPFYGQSTATWAALAGVTLLGVTLGNFAGGVLAQRARRPLFVALCGTLGGALLLAVVPSVLPFLAAVAGPENGGLVVFALAGFLPPTFFLGLVSPSVAATVVRADRNGSDLGMLYFASMLGYMLGSALAGLYLPFVLPTTVVCRLAALVLVGAGGVLAWAGRRRTADATAAPVTVRTVVSYGAQQRKTLVHVFLIGFLGMASELALARLVTPVLGGSHIVWSSVFITFIGCMGVGGIAGGKVADRFATRVPTKALYAVWALSLYLTTVFQTQTLGLWTMGYDAGLRIVLHVLVGFGPYAFVLGFLSAFLLQKATATALTAGNRFSIGLVYAVNGIGSSFGSFFAGMLCVGSASMLAALPGASRPLPAEIAVGEPQHVLARGESSYNSVSVTAQVENPHLVTIWLDRIPHTTVNTAEPKVLYASYTRLLDVSAEVLAPSNGCHALIIGGGGYALPRKWNEERAKYAEITVAEIDPLVSAYAHRFMDAPPDNEVIHNHIADGRRLVDRLVRAGETNRYDLVIGDTIGDAAIPYHLTTREFFARIADALLKPDGVYLMHALDVLDDPGILASLVRTLREVFPHVVAYSYAGTKDVRQSFVIAASRRRLDLAAMAGRLVERYPEAIPLSLSEDDCAALSRSESAVLLTDTFAPVERYVWRVMTRDVQYSAYMLAQRMLAFQHDGEYDRAYRLAQEVLKLQPEESRAIGILADAAKYGTAGAEKLLRQQAGRPSVSSDAKIQYAVYLKGAGRSEETLPIWRELVRRWPDNPHFAATLKALEK